MVNITIKAHYDAETLASMALPGLPTTRAAIFKRAKAEGWKFVEVPGKGGRGGMRREYAPPTEIMQAIQQKAASSLMAEVKVNTSAVVPTFQIKAAATSSQQLVAEARRGVLLAIQAMMEKSGYALKAAARILLEMAERGDAPDHIVNMLRLARDGRGRQSTTGLPSLSSVLRFMEYERAGTLVPRYQARDMSVPAWAPIFMECYQRPEKPTVNHAYETFCVLSKERGFNALPSIWQVRRFLDKVGKVSKEVGRMGEHELKSIRPFVRRDTSGMMPTDIYSADGHRFDAEVQHPIHGRPFRPEITSVIDVATRRLVGWSVGLAESALVVVDALRHASTRCGIPAIFYVDNGSGYKNHMMTDQATGLMGRLGTTLMHSLPYNSQAKGVIERSHQTIWVKAAKELPGYIGRDMDRQAALATFKLSRKAIKAVKTGEAVAMPLIGWPGFVEFCNAKVDEYNNQPHRALPKITDPNNGRRRHMSPNEAWESAKAKGFVPLMVTDEEARPLFRPQELRTVDRAEISLFGNRYFSKQLEEFHGVQVNVGYDVQDPMHIWVYDDEGRYICSAKWNGNMTKYVPQSVEDRAKEKRALGRLKRNDAHRAEIEEELHGRPALENMASVTIPGFLNINRDQLAQQAEAILQARQGAEIVEIREVKEVKEPAIVQTWAVPKEPQARYAEWLRISTLKEEELEDELQKNWRHSYTKTAEFRVLSKKTA